MFRSSRCTALALSHARHASPPLLRFLSVSPKKKLLRMSARALADASSAPSILPYSPVPARARARADAAAGSAAAAGTASDGVVAQQKTLRPITIALVGRPNVGKSSLFNRLSRSRLAIVNGEPGTTRDWKEAPGRLGELVFTVLDTGGLEGRARGAVGGVRSNGAALEEKMLLHTERAVAGADVVLFIIDGRTGVSPDDERFARWIKARRPTGGIILVANKAEGMSTRLDADGFEAWPRIVDGCYALGLGAPVPVSAEHAEGLGELYAAIEPFAIVNDAAGQTPSVALIGGSVHAGAAGGRAGLVRNSSSSSSGDRTAESTRSLLKPSVRARLARYDAGVIELAIVGRPNVGKSTLVNQLLGEERQLTGSTPGLTRDAVGVALPLSATRSVRIVDTAGMRRAGAWDLSTPIEGLAVGQAQRALALANVVALVVDGSGGDARGLTDERISFYAGGVGGGTLAGEGLSAGPGLSENLRLGGGRIGAAVFTESRGNRDRAVLNAAADGAAAAARAAVATSSSPVVPQRVGDSAPRATRVASLDSTPYGLTRQDLSIASQVLEEGRALVVVLNKVDAVGADVAAEVARVVRGQIDALPQGRGAELIPVSALRGGGIATLLPAIARSYERWNMRITTAALNSWLTRVVRVHPPPSIPRSLRRDGGRERGATTDGDAFRSAPIAVRLKYVTQVTSRPPTFAVFTNVARGFPEGYRRFLINALREDFALGGVPVRLVVRARLNPFKGARTRSGADAGPLGKGVVRRTLRLAPRAPFSQRARDGAGASDATVTGEGVGRGRVLGPVGTLSGGNSQTRPPPPRHSPDLARKARSAKLGGGSLFKFSRKQKREIAGRE